MARFATHDQSQIRIFDYWFASEERLRSHLKKITGHERIKGDYLKEQGRQFLNYYFRRRESGLQGRIRGPWCRKFNSRPVAPSSGVGDG